MSTDLATYEANGHAPASIGGGVPAILETMEVLKAVRTFVKSEFKANLDFGIIPGTGTKPTLLLPGAQKACMYFNSYPEYEIITHELGGGHVEYQIKTVIISRSTGQRVGSGLGLCSTMEGKYRFRKGVRVCPQCGKDAIIVGKAEYGGGFVCFNKKGGCGAKFKDGDAAITSQQVGQAENENIHDVRNTVLKIAKKRSFVDASIGLGCLSELFTQDLEDIYDLATMGEVANEPAEYPKQATAENATGHGRGSYAAPDEEEKYRKSTDEFIAKFNGAFLDRWTTVDGPVEGIREPANFFNLNKHMLKWCLSTGTGDLDPGIDTAAVKAGQVPRYCAIAYSRANKAFRAERTRYASQLARDEVTRWRKKHLEMTPECVGFEELIDDEMEAATAASDDLPEDPDDIRDIGQDA